MSYKNLRLHQVFFLISLIFLMLILREFFYAKSHILEMTQIEILLSDKNKIQENLKTAGILNADKERYYQLPWNKKLRESTKSFFLGTSVKRLNDPVFGYDKNKVTFLIEKSKLSKEIKSKFINLTSLYNEEYHKEHFCKSFKKRHQRIISALNPGVIALDLETENYLAQTLKKLKDSKKIYALQKLYCDGEKFGDPNLLQDNEKEVIDNVRLEINDFPMKYSKSIKEWRLFAIFAIFLLVLSLLLNYSKSSIKE